MQFCYMSLQIILPKLIMHATVNKPVIHFSHLGKSPKFFRFQERLSQSSLIAKQRLGRKLLL